MPEIHLADRFDLHTHSAVSDGTTEPHDIARDVATLGLAGFALTDHDTTEGWHRARVGAREQGVDFLPGIELTTTHRGRSIHLLAYGPDHENAALQDALTALRDSRLTRAVEMVRRMRDDFTLDWDALLALPETKGVQSIGRPHVADALVAAGYFADRSEAFATALSPSGPYYVPTMYLDTLDAIELVRSAQGFPVLAHPAAFRMRRPLELGLIESLTDGGLGGIELFHPENRDDWVAPMLPFATDLGLIITGASDYHGTGKPNRLGEQSTSIETVAKIRQEVATPH